MPPPWATIISNFVMLQRAGVKQIHDGAASCRRHIRLRTAARVMSVLRRFAVGRMDEHYRVAPVQLVEQRIEQRVAQVAVVDTGEKPDTVKVQMLSA